MPTRIKKNLFYLIQASFGPLIPKLCSDKSDIGGKINPGFSLVENPPNAVNPPMRNQDSFPPLSSFEISGPSEAIIR